MIRLENISLAYGDKQIIRNSNASFPTSTLTALIGRNGAGKSTLLRALAAIDAPQGGRIFVAGNDIQVLSSQQRARLISFVGTHRVRIANLKCRDVVAIGRAPYTNWLGSMQAQDLELVMQSLAAVGMEAFAERTIDSLSDGECQRIMIARALAQQTPIIILDEPTAFLDIPTRFEITRLLATLAHTQGKTIIFSTHDIDAAIPASDAIAVIDNCELNIHPKSQAEEVIKHLFSL